MSKKKNKNSKPLNAENMKRWARMQGEHSWTMFKVMAEFVEGFEKFFNKYRKENQINSLSTKNDDV